MLEVVYDAVSLILNGVELEEGLVAVAGLVARSMGGADGAGIALVDHGSLVHTVGSSRLVNDVDDLQYALNEGPCVSAVAESRAISTGTLRHGETRWPRFAEAVRPLGIASVLSLPLSVQQEVTGSISIYALTDDAFDGADATSGERLAHPVAAAIRSAQRTAYLSTPAGQDEEAMEARAQLAIAVGYLRQRDGVSSDTAWAELRRLASESRHTLVDVAATLAEESEASDRAD